MLLFLCQTLQSLKFIFIVCELQCYFVTTICHQTVASGSVERLKYAEAQCSPKRCMCILCILRNTAQLINYAGLHENMVINLKVTSLFWKLWRCHSLIKMTIYFSQCSYARHFFNKCIQLCAHCVFPYAFQHPRFQFNWETRNKILSWYRHPFSGAHRHISNKIRYF